jgi:hypothetical protein
MKRRVNPLALIALCALPFGSCTCSSSAPEPPPAKKVSGFGGLKPTMRSLPDMARGEGMVTPREVEPNAPPTVMVTPSAEARIPDNFPSDVPVFEGAEVMASQELANKANNVVFGVDAERPEVFRFYKDSMRGNGWNTTQEYEGKEQSFLSFQKDGMTTNVSIATDPKTGRKVIAVMYYKEEPLPFPEF